MSMQQKQKSQVTQTQTISNQLYPSVIQNKLCIIRCHLQNAMREIRSQQSSCQSLNFIKRISLNLDFQLVQKMLQDLQKGYIVIKHSVNTSVPHEKFLYISSDRKFLCWKSLEKNDEKFIELRKINDISKDVGINNGVIIASKTIKQVDKVIVVSSDMRVLEIQFKTEKQKNKCYQELKQAMKNSKRMHLSYKF